MAKDLNKVMITGRLGADPEMRYTPQGSAVTTFNVASGRTWKSNDGTSHDDTEWFRVVAWDKLGEICNQYLTKGTRVYVEGRLQTRKYQDRDGQPRTSVELVAADMIILSSRAESQGGGDAYDAGSPERGESMQRRAPAAPAQPRQSAPPPRNVPTAISDEFDDGEFSPPPAAPRQNIPPARAERKPLPPASAMPEDDDILPF
ncbi:MAG: single-stranded DNA-binding protein [Chloroflexi bacterium]|nr:MAG: single-stranded DNA-binding protein [Chloroflexota bacterium]